MSHEENDEKFIAIKNFDKKRLRALLIEDEKSCQLATKTFFENLSCDLDIAATAQKAIELLETAYDIIFLDIGLPDRDGIVLARRIRRELKINTPIIATTAYSWDPSAYEDVGINGCIKKPLSQIKIQRALSRFIKK